jgi:hypothetical protein
MISLKIRAVILLAWILPAGFAAGQSASLLQGGENIASAVVLNGPLPVSVSGTTAGFQDDYDEACPYPGSEAPDVVYAYTPSSSMLVDIDLCGSAYDTKVFVYENAATPGIPYGCNDDYYFDLPCGMYVSKIEALQLTGGYTYYIIVDGYSSEAFGDYNLAISQADTEPQCIWGIDIICPAWAVAESETCGEDENGGCNMPEGTEYWEPVPGSGATYCGTLWADNGNRDTDWFELVLTEPSMIILTANADRQVFYGLVETTTPGAPSCSGTTGITNPISQAGPCNETSIDLGLVNPGTYWFIVGMTADDGFPCTNHYLFDIDINPIPCSPPGSLSATGITYSSATLGWFETGTTTTWEYQYGVAGFTPAASGSSTSSNPVAISGLTINTSYEFYVRAVCGEGVYSIWSGPYSFSTPCGPVTALPWSEGFETSWPPACWTDDNQIAGYGWDPGFFGSPNSGSKWAYSNLANSVLASPEIYVDDDAFLFFCYRAENKDFPRGLTVKVNGDIVFQVNGFTNEAYKSASVSLIPYTGQTISVSFESSGGSGGSDFGICLDDVSVKYAGKWTGNISSAWNHPGNWESGVIPGINDVLVIPSAPPGGNFPEIGNSVSANCYHITVSPGATVKVKSGGTLHILN